MTEQKQAQAALDDLDCSVGFLDGDLFTRGDRPRDFVAKNYLILRTALKHLADPDMVLVPRTASAAMIRAAIDRTEYGDLYEGIYTAMIEAYEQEKK